MAVKDFYTIHQINLVSAGTSNQLINTLKQVSKDNKLKYCNSLKLDYSVFCTVSLCGRNDSFVFFIK